MALIDPQVLKDKLAAIGTELIQNGKIPPDVVAKIPVWTAGIAFCLADAVAAKEATPPDAARAARALRDAGLYQQAFRAEVTAADLRGLTAGEAAVRRIADIALDVAIKAVMTLL